MSTSRIVRIVIGLGLIGYGIYSQNSWFYLGVIPLMMGILDICPRKMLSKYFVKEECCEGDSCCTPQNASEENSCCSVPSSDDQAKWSISKENKKDSTKPKDGEILIEILGTGCGKCIALKKIVDEVVSTLDKPTQVKKVEDINEIMSYNVVSTPGFVINGKVLTTGKLLTAKEVEDFINKA